MFCVFYFIKISKFALPGVMLIYERTSKDRKKERQWSKQEAWSSLHVRFGRAVAAYSKVVRRKKSLSAEGTRGGRAREGRLFPLSSGVGGLPREFFF